MPQWGYEKNLKQIKQISLGSTNYNPFVSDFLQLGIKWQFFKVSIDVAEKTGDI